MKWFVKKEADENGFRDIKEDDLEWPEPGWCFLADGQKPLYDACGGVFDAFCDLASNTIWVVFPEPEPEV